MRISLRHVSKSVSISRGCNQVATSTEEAWAAARPYQDIPGPTPLPIIGNTWRFIPGIGELYAEDFVRQHKYVLSKYGELVKVTHIPGRKDLVFVFNSADIETVFRNDSAWPARPPLESLTHYRTVTRGDFFKGLAGLSTDQGEAWYRTRTVINPVMMKTQNVHLYAKRINDVAEEFVVKIPGWRNHKSEMPKTFQNELHKWALESIAVVALDTRLGCMAPNLAADSEAQHFIDAVQIMLHSIHTLDMGPRLWKKFPTPAWKKFVTTMDFIVEVSMKHISKVIESSKDQKTLNDEDSSVLQKMLARDPDPIRAVIMALDMLIAGIDTTSSSLVNTLLCLSMNPEKQDKLHKELCKFLPGPEDIITSEKLNEMKYLRAVIRETMRFQPIISLNARSSQKEMVLSNYRIPAGVDLLLVNALTSRMEKNFPKADKFIPERWLRNEENPFPDNKINPFVSLPFGYGARKCVGMRFASLELEILLAKLVRRFQWEWHYPEVRYKSSLIQIPVDPLHFTVNSRH